MAKITLSKLNLKISENTVPLQIGDLTASVKTYLPQEEKGNFLQFVADNAIDVRTGCFSPLRTETYFSLAIVKFYTDISFTDKQLTDAGKTYDLLQQNGIFQKIVNLIPQEEYDYLRDLVEDTLADISRFNNSFAGMISAMSSDSKELNDQLTDIISKIQSGEGIKLLKEIREGFGQNKSTESTEK